MFKSFCHILLNVEWLYINIAKINDRIINDYFTSTMTRRALAIQSKKPLVIVRIIKKMKQF